MSSTGQPGRADWSEADSDIFIDYGRYFVPERGRLIRTMVELVPVPEQGSAHVVELCCGEGLLTAALLRRYPDLRVLALDGSPAMLASTRRHAGADAGRLTTREFALEAADWRRFDAPPCAVLSSLAVHHLDGAGKRRLFADMAVALAPGGALIVCDIVRPTTAVGWRIAAQAWDESVAETVRRLDGADAALDAFRRDGWNFYADPEPDPIDQPSGLFEQLQWLADAGLADVDVHWMLAGHAIFGGRKPG